MEQGMKRLLLAGRGQWHRGLWEEGNLTVQEHPDWLGNIQPVRVFLHQIE
jgi:hypothetical protein